MEVLSQSHNDDNRFYPALPACERLGLVVGQ
jgi:hypothetical protein